MIIRETEAAQNQLKASKANLKTLKFQNSMMTSIVSQDTICVILMVNPVEKCLKFISSY